MTPAAHPSEVTSHFWVAASPYFTSMLYITPYAVTGGESVSGLSEPTILEFRDSDGNLFNTAEFQFPLGEVGCLDVTPLFVGCKLESGLMHAHLTVRSSGEVKHICRLQASGAASLTDGLVTVRSRESISVPLTINALRERMVVLVNFGNDPANVACKLYFGNRSPEVSFEVPPLGVRLLSLEDEFGLAGVVTTRDSAGMQSYLRVSSRNQGSIGMTIVEHQLPEGGVEEQYRVGV